MFQKTRFAIWTIFIVFVLCLSLVNVQSAFADDDAPPTEPPVATEEATEPPAAPTEIPATDIPATETPVEEEPVTELLSLVPDTTDVVVLDEDGNPVSLASQEAAEIVTGNDPMWCPEGILPNGPGCVAFTGDTPAQNITNLLTAMRNNAGGYYSRNGVIYFERSGLTTFNTAFVLDDSGGSLGGSYNTLKNFNITLRGGWNGGGTSTFHATQSSIFDNDNNAVVGVGSAGNPWVGNVTLQDIFIQDNGQSSSNSIPSVRIFTTNGSVTLNDVDLDDIDDATAIQIAVSGTGSVNLTDVDVTDGTDGSGITISTTSGPVSLTNVLVYEQQDGNGITITTTSGNISFNNVDSDNQYDGYTANLTTQSGNISITNGSYFDGRDGNDNRGFSATTNTGSITITGTSANRIIFEDARGPGTGTNYNGLTLSAPTVTLNYVTADGNDGNGIAISNANIVTLNNVIATNNGTDIGGGTGGGGFSNDIGSGVRINGNPLSWVSILDGTFTGNQRYGIEAFNTSIFVGSSIDSCQTTSNSGGCSNVTLTNDFTPPTITLLSRTPPANGFGWNNTDVTVTWSCSDAQSGVVSATVSQTVSSEGTNQSASGTCTNKAGLSSSATVTGINIDKTAPTITFTNRTPPANGNGWNNTDVVVNWSCADSRSGVVSASVSQTVSSEGANQSAIGTCTDRAENTASNTQSGINIDKTAPTASAVPSPAPNGNGWNNTDVVVSFTGTDALSGIASCSPAVTLSSQGAGQSASGTCTDNAGNVSAPATANVNIDKTPPVLSLPANITVSTFLPSVAVNYLATVTDNLDGAVTVNCLPASGSSFPLGTTTVNCSSTDHADNTSNGSFTVTVNAIVEAEAKSSSSFVDFFIPITGGAPFSLNCVTPGTFSVQMEDVHITFNNLCGFDAIAESINAAGLPGTLPNGQSFISGVSIEILEDGKAVNPLPDNASIVVEFSIPDGKKNGEFAILSWNGAKWVEVDGNMNSDGRFQAAVEDDGTFILVMK